MLSRISAATLLCLIGTTLWARDYGPPLGAKLPEFALQDQSGKKQSLKTVMGPKGAVILFFRSADWCPFCKAQLVELEQHQSEFQKLGLNVAAISYDSPAVLRAFAERKSIHFPMLSDPDSKIIRELRLLNGTVAKDSSSYRIPYPGSFIVNSKGVITAKYFDDDYRQRYTSAGILLRQFGLITGSNKNDFEGKQLKLTAAATSSMVSAGQRVTLTLDVELKPNMHVYAPGVEGYIPIDWKMEASPTAVPLEVSYPASEKLYLKAVGESVASYTDRFRLTRDINIGPDDKLKPAVDNTGKFTVDGTLKYQACDDRLCYLPQQLPVHWSFQYQPPDQQRVPEALRRKSLQSKQ